MRFLTARATCSSFSIDATGRSGSGDRRKHKGCWGDDGECNDDVLGPFCERDDDDDDDDGVSEEVSVSASALFLAAIGDRVGCAH